MKEKIHPENYRLVVFEDISNGYRFLCKSCASSKETTIWTDGKEYPLVKIEVSHTSHPFFTKKMRVIDASGRAEKFMKRWAKFQEKEQVKQSKPTKDKKS